MIGSSKSISIGDAADEGNIIQPGKSSTPACTRSACGDGHHADRATHRVSRLPGSHRRAGLSRFHHDHLRSQSGKQMCSPVLPTNSDSGGRWDLADFNPGQTVLSARSIA